MTSRGMRGMRAPPGRRPRGRESGRSSRVLCRRGGRRQGAAGGAGAAQPQPPNGAVSRSVPRSRGKRNRCACESVSIGGAKGQGRRTARGRTGPRLRRGGGGSARRGQAQGGRQPTVPTVPAAASATCVTESAARPYRRRSTPRVVTVSRGRASIIIDSTTVHRLWRGGRRPWDGRSRPCPPHSLVDRGRRGGERKRHSPDKLWRSAQAGRGPLWCRRRATPSTPR